ncbi:MAG: glycosyltransferase [Burkholderiales bacterium]|nr:glycosyltransferase [Burkholderiales bacterium]MCE7878636.1 glycosyltransferase [Betaproteobacteria bacterium PRO3]
MPAQIERERRSIDVRASAILTYCGGQGDGDRGNLDAVLRWLAGQRDLETIVVEQGDRPRLVAPAAHPDARVVFAFREGPLRKGWGRNVGARHASGDVLLFGDADVIVPGGLANAAAQCSARYEVVKPHGRLVALTPEETAHVREHGPDGTRPDGGGSRGRGEDPGGRQVLCEGWFAIRRDAFEAIGGFDERIAGSLAQDESVSLKVELARLSTCALDDRPALRLCGSRPQQTASARGDAASDAALLDAYARCDDAARARVAAVARQLHGRRDKYAPDAR